MLLLWRMGPKPKERQSRKQLNQNVHAGAADSVLLYKVILPFNCWSRCSKLPFSESRHTSFPCDPQSCLSLLPRIYVEFCKKHRTIWCVHHETFDTSWFGTHTRDLENQAISLWTSDTWIYNSKAAFEDLTLPDTIQSHYRTPYESVQYIASSVKEECFNWSALLGTYFLYCYCNKARRENRACLPNSSQYGLWGHHSPNSVTQHCPSIQDMNYQFLSHILMSI